MSETPVFNGVAVRPLGENAARDVMGDGARPAVFDGKKLVRVSTCPWHPKYQGRRAPGVSVKGPGRVGYVPCPRCVAIWNRIESLKNAEEVPSA